MKCCHFGSPKLLVVTANHFAYTTLTLFSILKVWIQFGSSVAILCFTSLFWTILYSSMTYGNIHFGHFCRHEVGIIEKLMFGNVHFNLTKTTLQALKTTEILHKIINQDQLGLFRERIMTFSQQLLHRIPVFSCGLFTFDLNLAFKVNQMISLKLGSTNSWISDDQHSHNLLYYPHSVWVVCC